MNGSLRRLAVASFGLALTASLLVATSSPASASSQGDDSRSVAPALQPVAALVSDTGEVVQQQVFCDFAWGAQWTAGNPTDLTYFADVWCAPHPDVEVVGFVQAVLIGEDGEVLDEAPEEPVLPLDPTPTVSESTISIERPSTQHILELAELLLVPTAPGQIWVWLFLPEGCDGIGTPLALCDIHYDQFTVPG